MSNSILYKLGIASVMAVLTAGNIQAQESKATSRNLSMTEAIELSLKNSKQLKLSNAKVDEAIANRHEMWDNHLPDLKVTGSYIRLNSPDVSLKVKLGSSSSSGSGSGENANAGGGVKVDQAAYALVNGSLPLFSGLRIHYGVESAKYLEQAAKLDADNDKEDVIQNTINAYSNLYKALKTIDLIKENLKQQQQRETDFSNLERNGLIARNDLLKVQLQRSNIELSLLDAQNNYNIACINMNLMLGLPEDAMLIPDSAAFSRQYEDGSIAQWEEQALKNRKDLEALSYREKAAVSGIKATKGEYYPGIALTGGLIAADIPNVLTISNALNAGIGLSYNFGALWKTGAKVNVAKARLHQVEASQGLLADRLRLQINQSYQNYLLSKKKVDVYAQAVAQANENFRITKNKYTNNLVTTTDLLDADVAQLQANLNYAFSKVDAVVAYEKLLQTAGMLGSDFQSIR